MVVQPGDVNQDTAHLDILLSTMLLTDKPIMGSSASKAAAGDSLKKHVWVHSFRVLESLDMTSYHFASILGATMGIVSERQLAFG